MSIETNYKDFSKNTKIKISKVYQQIWDTLHYFVDNGNKDGIESMIYLLREDINCGNGWVLKDSIKNGNKDIVNMLIKSGYFKK